MIVQSEGKLIEFQAKSAWDDYWYNPIGAAAATGLNVTGETAETISAVWACVDLISSSLASISLPIYERRPDGDREPAYDYYLYNVIHDQPNHWQTSMEFREMLTSHMVLRGNGYAYIQPGRRGFAEQLIPLNPARMDPQQQPDGSILYRYTGGSNGPATYTDEEIFHLRGRSRDGIKGMSVLQYARESFGLALATEQYGGRFFGNGARPSGVLKTKTKLNPDTKKRLKEEWESAHGGVNRSHNVAVLEEDLEWQAIGVSNEDSQFLATREFQVEDIARWFRVPLHMIQSTSKTTSWGSGIEQLSLAFVIYTLLPWARRWEGGIRRDLINDTSRYYAEHLFEALLRGDIKTRYEAYGSGRQWGFLSVNDIRHHENWNRIKGGDVYLEPENMRPAGTYGRTEPALTPAQPPANQGNAHYDLLLHEAAARVIRKEITALTKAAKRCASDLDAWRQAIDEFYAEHAGHVAQALRIDAKLAGWWAQEQRALLLEFGAAAMEEWETERVGELVALVKGESVGCKMA